jgi:hypothetical protein
MASFDFGAILDKSIDAASALSVARVERDTARYEAAAAEQQAALHNSEATNMREAYATGNARNPAVGQGNTVGGYIDRIPKPLLFGSIALLGVGLVMRAGS